MADNDVKTSDDAEMSECDGEKVVTMMDVLQEQQDFEEDANAVLGASDDKNCTYSKGYVKRQAIYACLTCCPDAKTDSMKRAGVCLACSLTCHENHELVELYTKRNFRCDCGNPKFSQPCQFTPNKSDLNYDNKYNQNFSGVYCVCQRPYPDPESTEEEEMIQCIICEDWLHTNHLEATVPTNDQYSEMICKDCMEDNDFLHDYSELVVNVADKEIIVTDPDLDVATILRDKAIKEAAAKKENPASAVAETPDKEAADNVPETLNTEKEKLLTDDDDMTKAKPESNGDADKEDASNSEENIQIENGTIVEDKDDEMKSENAEKENTQVENKDAEATDKPEISTEADSATDTTKDDAKPESTETGEEIPKENEKDSILTSDMDKNTANNTKNETNETVSTEKPKEDEKIDNFESSDSGSPGKIKRKLSTENIEDISPKKAKLDTKPCIRPRVLKRVYNGATFWPSTFRQKLCTCNECIAMYKDLAVLFITDQDDTVSAYEALGKIYNEGALSSQYEKGLQALSSLDRVQQINALTEYNKMRDKLLDFLKSFKDRKEIVKEEDIKAFFAGMKPKREPDGVYFCR